MPRRRPASWQRADSLYDPADPSAAEASRSPQDPQMGCFLLFIKG